MADSSKDKKKGVLRSMETPTVGATKQGHAQHNLLALATYKAAQKLRACQLLSALSSCANCDPKHESNTLANTHPQMTNQISN